MVPSHLIQSDKRTVKATLYDQNIVTNFKGYVLEALKNLEEGTKNDDTKDLIIDPTGKQEVLNADESNAYYS